GYKAAELLEKLMDGAPIPKEPILLPPSGVETRQSTDTLAVEDPTVAQAIRFIRANAHKPIQVSDVLEQVSISRRTLEHRLSQTLGRTPAEEIRHARVQIAKKLLGSTDESMPWIAAHSGFEYAEVLTRVFRRELGTTPTAYRRQFRN